MTSGKLHGLIALTCVLATVVHSQEPGGVRMRQAGSALPDELAFISFLDFVVPDDGRDNHVILEHVADATGIRFVVDGRIDAERMERVRGVTRNLQQIRADFVVEKKLSQARILCSGPGHQTVDQIVASVNGIDGIADAIARKYFHLALRQLERQERQEFEAYLKDFKLGISRTSIDARVGLEARFGDLAPEDRDRQVHARLAAYCDGLAAEGFTAN